MANEGRREALRLLALSETRELDEAFMAWSDAVSYEVLRPPEFTLVMVTGRIGGSGPPFNMGETTMTRAAIRLESGEVGFGHVLGRDRRKALLVAVLDGLWQSPAHRGAVVKRLLEPIRLRLGAADETVRRQAAATQVEFLTMARGATAG